jgi:hypothetical protein
MSQEDLKGIAELAKIDDDLIVDSGGEAGGAPKVLLKRSELATLRRMADRYPINSQERADTVAQVMDIVRNAKSKRLRIAAVKALTGLDKVNLDEVKTVILAKRLIQAEKGDVNVNVQTNVAVQVRTPQSVLDEYSDIISGPSGEVPAGTPAIDDPEQQVRAAETNGKAGQVRH